MISTRRDKRGKREKGAEEQNREEKKREKTRTEDYKRRQHKRRDEKSSSRTQQGHGTHVITELLWKNAPGMRPNSNTAFRFVDIASIQYDMLFVFCKMPCNKSPLLQLLPLRIQPKMHETI